MTESECVIRSKTYKKQDYGYYIKDTPAKESKDKKNKHQHSKSKKIKQKSEEISTCDGIYLSGKAPHCQYGCCYKSYCGTKKQCKKVGIIKFGFWAFIILLLVGVFWITGLFNIIFGR